MNEKPREEKSYKSLYPNLSITKKLNIINPIYKETKEQGIQIEKIIKEKIKGKDLCSVEYSATQQDQSFISTYLKHNTEFEDKYGIIAVNLYELIMDRILKEWRLWQMKTIKLFYSTYNRKNKKRKCVICTLDNENEDNIVLICNGCNLNVHQECYGVPNLEKYTSIEESIKNFYFLDSLWFCRKCLFFKDKVPKCKYCNTDGNAYKQIQNTKRWGHILCVKFIETLSYSNMVFMEPIEELKSDEVQIETKKSLQPKQQNIEFSKKTCFVCNYKKGSVIKCAHKACELYYHVTCGINTLLYFDMKNNISYCEKHDPEKGGFEGSNTFSAEFNSLQSTAYDLDTAPEFINLKHVPEIRKREPIFVQEQTFIHKVAHLRPRFSDFVANRIICNDLCMFNDRLVANFAIEIGMFWNVRNNRYYEVEDIFSLDGYNWKKWDESRNVICVPTDLKNTKDKNRVIKENIYNVQKLLNEIKEIHNNNNSTESRQTILKKFQSIIEIKCTKLHIKTYGLDLNDELKKILQEMKEMIILMKNKEILKQEMIQLKINSLSFLNKGNWKINCILKELRSYLQFKIFENPVTEKIAPGYSKIIKDPRCFKDIEAKADEFDYTLKSFEADINIIVNNCRVYNAGIAYFIDLSNQLEKTHMELSIKYQDLKLSETQTQKLKEILFK